ncbi:type II toxin-antitoxin system RelE/ParE family toxin [Bradyrhizobium oligotrophicum]|uniref:type II toxin-antitoxin system RelE/ParE family toxin n=1 Tax=Bradyrhizobium oligotrophicum TaxID=44255 RepID=UPI003EBF0B0A
MRIFKVRVFARLARRAGISDASLVQAVADAERGLIEADLGGGVIKQRVARPGAGKSGGYRVLLAYRTKTMSIFLHVFAKSDIGNIGVDELRTLRDIARYWLQASSKTIDGAVADGNLLEMEREGGKENKNEN